MPRDPGRVSSRSTSSLPRTSDELIRILRYQYDKAIENVALGWAEDTIGAIPELDDTDDESPNLILLPDGRQVDVTWELKIYPKSP